MTYGQRFSEWLTKAKLSEAEHKEAMERLGSQVDLKAEFFGRESSALQVREIFIVWLRAWRREL